MTTSIDARPRPPVCGDSPVRAPLACPCRFTMVSRAASIASLLQPIERWPVRIVAATKRHPAGLRPADQATAVTSAVTATVGPGWQASSQSLQRSHRHHDVTMTRIAAVRPALPPYRYQQAELTDAFASICLPDGRGNALLRRLHANAGVSSRHLALPLEQYGVLKDFGAANDAWIATAVDLGAEAVAGAVADAGLELSDVDVLMFTTVTGVAAPSIDARVAVRLGTARRREAAAAVRTGVRRGCGRDSAVARLSDCLAEAGRRTAVCGAVLADTAARRLVVCPTWSVVRSSETVRLLWC